MWDRWLRTMDGWGKAGVGGKGRHYRAGQGRQAMPHEPCLINSTRTGCRAAWMAGALQVLPHTVHIVDCFTWLTCSIPLTLWGWCMPIKADNRLDSTGAAPAGAAPHLSNADGPPGAQRCGAWVGRRGIVHTGSLAILQVRQHPVQDGKGRWCEFATGLSRCEVTAWGAVGRDGQGQGVC